MINNRQNGRRRGRGGNNNNGGGGGNNQRHGSNQGRGDGANRIDSRARGNANQLYEKYKNLARDAQMSGDRVNIEYYLQFADHYFRVLADQRSRMENDNQPRRQQPFDINGDDDDDVNEGEPIRSGEQNGADRDDRQQNDRHQNNLQQNDRQSGDGQHNDRPQGQNVRRERGDGGEQQRHARNNERNNEQRSRRDRDDATGEITDAPASGESIDSRREQKPESEAPVAAPRRRGRPRRDDAAPATGAGSEEAAPAAVIAADRLPPSLGIAAANDAEDAPKPRRRTRRPAAEAPAAE